MKKDYYELLEVATDATDIELKKAYRKAALKHHPDKNRDRIEEATILFAEVKAAYEVLSDPQERSWYDSHKNQILREDFDDGEYGHYDNDIDVGITVDDLMRFFDPILYTRFDDSPAGFYKIVTGLFDTLKQDETSTLAKPDHDSFPIFGHSESDYETVVRKFYMAWSNFQSAKTFEWFDQYNVSSRMDRRTRRHVEKTNKKLRDAAKKAYNETVRDLVLFLKKRDPRVKAGVEKLEQKKKLQKKQQHEENQKKLRRNQNLKEDFKVQDWQKYDFEEIDFNIDANNNDAANFDETGTGNDVYSNDSGTELEIEVFECIVCDKLFKSEKQLFAHELTNKHKKELKRLRWQMKKEGLNLGLDIDDVEAEDDDNAYLTANESDLDDIDNKKNDEICENEIPILLTHPEQSDLADDDVANLPIDDEIKLDDEDITDDGGDYDDFTSENYVKLPAIGKRKNKKEKKKEQQKNKNLSKFEQETHNYSAMLSSKDDDLKKLSEAIEKGISLDFDDDDDDWSIGNKKKTKSKRKKK